jgi:hypothetical protein
VGVLQWWCGRRRVRSLVQQLNGNSNPSHSSPRKQLLLQEDRSSSSSSNRNPNSNSTSTSTSSHSFRDTRAPPSPSSRRPGKGHSLRGQLTFRRSPAAASLFPAQDHRGGSSPSRTCPPPSSRQSQASRRRNNTPGTNSCTNRSTSRRVCNRQLRENFASSR